MKKGLSILLIAAALFGFYGGATSLNDILASKDYWEEVGEQSTADMNKLEDGLNQLKDNEQAYLDGKEQLAEGEAKLADAEVQLAEGRATLAKGEADYAAAPAKLAAGKAAIDKGEKDLASLNALISGMESLIDGFEKPQSGASTSLKDGYETLRDGRDNILKNLDKMGAITGKLDALGLSDANKAGIFKAIKVFQKQAKTPITHTNADYKEFVDALKDLKPGLDEANTKLTAALNNIPTLLNGYDTIQGASGDEAGYNKCLSTLDSMITAAGNLGNATLKGGLEQIKGGVVTTFNTVKQSQPDAVAYNIAVNGSTALGITGAKQYVYGLWNTDVGGTLVKDSLSANLTLAQTYQPVVVDYLGKCNAAIEGYPILSGDTANKGRATMAGGVATIVTKVYDSKNKKLIKGLENAARAAGISNVKAFAASMVKDQYSMDDFHENMLKATKAFKIALPQLKKTASSGQKTLAAGKKEYKQGLADYAAAPGKLAAGRKQLADGEAQYADGVKQLEDGKAQLAQYEDGEQQIRDGLATLMATEPDPGLTSILERIGDDDFDNGDAHLEIEEGLNAVEVGRGYQADSGELITKEITNRAVGTAAGLAAGALAVLAAILSFLKKNKGAGISALIAGAAGLLGCFVGMGAGEYYSDIAGSTVGNMPFIAAGVLAAVSIVFAIIHFQAKPEAKPEAK